MRINISTIKGQCGAQLERCFTIPLMPGLQWGESIKQLSPIQVRAIITNSGSCYLLRGIINVELQLICHRCMKPYKWHLQVPLEEEFFPAEKSNGEENELAHLFARESTFSGDVIDLHEAVREQVILGLPTKNLCRADCPGLCPGCGADLAVEECKCSTTQIDPRLAPLARLLTDAAERESRN